MGLGDRVVGLAAFMKLELPGGDVRLSDGGALSFDGEIYQVRHPVWGSITEVPQGEASVAGMAPGGSIALAPNPVTAVSVLTDPAIDGSRVQAWFGEVDWSTGIASSPERLGDWFIDVTVQRIGRGSRVVVFELLTRIERMFLTNRGNVCSPRFHKSIYPGEKGFDNCTDVEVTVPWGTEAAPSGKTGGGAIPGGGGRTWLDAIRR